jgi:hypothetical protein
MAWLSSPLIIRLFPYLDYHESVILQKTTLKVLILIIKSTYQGWYHVLVLRSFSLKTEIHSCVYVLWRKQQVLLWLMNQARTFQVIQNLAIQFDQMPTHWWWVFKVVMNCIDLTKVWLERFRGDCDTLEDVAQVGDHIPWRLWQVTQTRLPWQSGLGRWNFQTWVVSGHMIWPWMTTTTL